MSEIQQNVILLMIVCGNVCVCVGAEPYRKLSSVVFKIRCVCVCVNGNEESRDKSRRVPWKFQTLYLASSLRPNSSLKF